MPTIEKIYYDVIKGNRDNNIKFSDLQKLLKALEFENVRIKGDHFIYVKSGIDDIINIQPNGNKAKGYQVKQIRELIVKNKMEV